MKITNKEILELSKKFGDMFYLIDTNQFLKNYKELYNSFKKYYDNFYIAYSYKTNYIPELCKIINKNNGYAEVVSPLELQLALKIGVKPNKIIWNGPIKDYYLMKKIIDKGIIVNIDSLDDLYLLNELSKTTKKINVGIRCNYDVGDEIISRFGIDINNKDFYKAIKLINSNEKFDFYSLHVHFAKRDINYWRKKVDGMIQLLERTQLSPKMIDLGGGLFGKMDFKLESQLGYNIPSYKDYAEVIAKKLSTFFRDKKIAPILVIEPGTALVGDCMKFVGTVKSIKNVRGKYFATLMASQKNISMANINPPITIIKNSKNRKKYTNVDFVGYTCIESDIIYKNYNGYLGINDKVLISNCGSYSIVMKPPFIMQNCPIIDCGNNLKVIKKQETFNNIFETYNI